MRFLDLVFKAVETTEQLVDRARGTKRRKLAVVPEPPGAPDPFVARAAPAVEAEKPLGDPAQPAQVFGRRGDPWSGRVVRVLQDRNVEHQFVDLDAPENIVLETKLVRETKQNDAPWVYLRGEFLGGFNAVNEIDRLGQLELRCMTPEEREKEQRGRTRIEVPKRGPEQTPSGER
jgi:glutaredoxin